MVFSVLISRRSLFAILPRLMAWVVGAISAIVLAQAIGFAGPRRARRAELLGRVAEFPMSSIQWISARQLFVVHDEDGLWALSARCTHLGCMVRRTALGFSCPCHGAQFDLSGRPVHGPARRSLDRMPVESDAAGNVYLTIL
jgi:nitrite reductase/ring-hydroxylating ferredoxin subunit